MAIPRGSRARVVIYSASKGGCFRAVSMFSGFLFWEVEESPQPRWLTVGASRMRRRIWSVQCASRNLPDEPGWGAALIETACGQRR